MVTRTLAGDIWSKIEFDLSEFHDLFHMHLETKKEAVGKRISPANRKTGRKAEWSDTAPRWEDEKHGISVRAWLMIPYVDAIDRESLQERLEAGRRLLASVEQRIAARELTPELIHEWGLLNRWAGVLQLVYLSETSIGHQRSALAGGEAKIEDAEAHQRWFAHYFLRHYKRGKREGAEKAVERLVNAIIDGKTDLPPGYNVKWFEGYLKLDDPGSPGYAKLKPAFDEHSLSVRRMKGLVAMGAEGTPPVDLEIPDP